MIAFCLISFLIVVLLIQSYFYTRIQIVKIVKEKSKIKIQYLLGNKLNELSGDSNHFSFIKAKLWYKVRGTLQYLIIQIDEKEKLRQYAIGDFNENVFNYILDAFGSKDFK